jgi:DNA-binding FadR family transcriptional regulator
VENTSGNTVQARLWRGRLDPGANLRTVTEHELIYEAILDGDSERARLRAATHIIGVEDAVRAMTGSRRQRDSQPPSTASTVPLT